MIPSSAPPPRPFFLNAGEAARFCLYHAAAQPYRGGWLYVHPFAEELNKSRRMAALQARALAQSGFAVLQMDLYGCGDSAGDFGDASWQVWLDDIQLALAWLASETGSPPGLWGLRLGASLAVDYARCGAPTRLLLWQPVCQGTQYLRQFLRLKVAGDALEQNSGAGVAAMRQSLLDGTVLEIAGYQLSPALAQAIDSLDLCCLAPRMPLDRNRRPMSARRTRRCRCVAGRRNAAGIRPGRRPLFLGDAGNHRMPRPAQPHRLPCMLKRRIASNAMANG